MNSKGWKLVAIIGIGATVFLDQAPVAFRIVLLALSLALFLAYDAKVPRAKLVEELAYAQLNLKEERKMNEQLRHSLRTINERERIRELNEKCFKPLVKNAHIKHMGIRSFDGKLLYVCNEATKATPSKVVGDWPLVTCKNCLKAQLREIKARFHSKGLL